MKKKTLLSGLIILWLLSFLLSLLVPLYLKKSMPYNFGSLSQQGFETFGPGLGAMLAFVFAPEVAPRQKRRLADTVAPAVALAYAGVFDGLMLAVAARQIPAADAVEIYRMYRPYFSILVTGMIAYYFGVKPS
jgi:hypothetical protein